jgi:hypothetical protein
MPNPLVAAATSFEKMNITLPRACIALRRIAAFSALVCLALALAGCGGGGGGGSAPPVVPPTNWAPLSLNGHSLTFTDPDQSQFTTKYVFSSGTYASPSGDSGTYTYTQTANVLNKGTLNLISSFSPAETYYLTYTSASGGTYVNQLNETSTFTMQ